MTLPSRRPTACSIPKISKNFPNGPIAHSTLAGMSPGFAASSCHTDAKSRFLPPSSTWCTRSRALRISLPPQRQMASRRDRRCRQLFLVDFYELIERDALLITWMNRLPAIEIEMPEDGSPAAAIIRHYSHFGVRLRAFLMRTDQPAAVVMAVASETDPARPARLIGMGCDLNPQVALNKAIFEYCQARPSEITTLCSKSSTGASDKL